MIYYFIHLDSSGHNINGETLISEADCSIYFLRNLGASLKRCDIVWLGYICHHFVS